VKAALRTPKEAVEGKNYAKAGINQIKPMYKYFHILVLT
jgi:hypothetical protein